MPPGTDLLPFLPESKCVSMVGYVTFCLSPRDLGIMGGVTVSGRTVSGDRSLNGAGKVLPGPFFRGGKLDLWGTARSTHETLDGPGVGLTPL
jgi:hypothetical protein